MPRREGLKRLMLITFSSAFLCVLALPSYADDQEGHNDCVTEWCDAVFPPPEGTDRSIGKDNCGNVCIKIQSIVEVEKVIYLDSITGIPWNQDKSVVVTLQKDENGDPIITASCPMSGFNQYDLEALKAGYELKFTTRKGKTYSYWR